MADNTVLPGTGEAVRDLDKSGIKTQVMALDAGGAGAESLVTATNPLPISINAAGFITSTANSTVAQLAAGATWTGTVESTVNQPALSWLAVSDQPLVVTISQYIDLAGTQKVKDIVRYIEAGKGFSESLVLNGDYIKFSVLNNGRVTTTTLNINVGYGTINVSDDQGNLPVIIQGSEEFTNTSLIESCIIGDLALSTQTINPEKRDINGASIPSDAPSSVEIIASVVGNQILIDTQGYQTLSLSMGSMAGTVTGRNDTKGTFGAVSCFPVVLGVPVTTAAANTNYIIPCFTRYIKITCTTVGWATYTLRQQPLPAPYLANTPMNVAQIGGAATAAGTAQLGVSLINVNAAVHSSTNPVYVSPVAVAATNSQTIHSNIITATAAAVSQLKASAGRLTMLTIQNNSANIGFLHLQNNAAATTATAAVQTYVIPASIGATVTVKLPDGGLYMSAGIAYTVSSVITSGDATALTAPSIAINAAFI